MAWRVVKTLLNPEGDRRIQIAQSDAGLFSFWVEKFFGPAEEDEGYRPDGFWHPAAHHGYYPTADDAERGARGEIDWLRPRD